jgi:hypothetical protein
VCWVHHCHGSAHFTGPSRVKYGGQVLKKIICSTAGSTVGRNIKNLHMNRVYEESKFCTLQHGATKETWRFVQVGLVNFLWWPPMWGASGRRTLSRWPRKKSAKHLSYWRVFERWKIKKEKIKYDNLVHRFLLGLKFEKYSQITGVLYDMCVILQLFHLCHAVRTHFIFVNDHHINKEIK